jgi:hypothetical protein
MRNASKLLLTMLVVSLVCMAAAALVVSCPPEDDDFVPIGPGNTGTNTPGDTGTNTPGQQTGTNPPGQQTGTNPPGQQTGTNPPGNQTGPNVPQPGGVTYYSPAGTIADWTPQCYRGTLEVALGGVGVYGDAAYRMTWSSSQNDGNGAMWANIPTDINLNDYTHVVFDVQNDDGLIQDINVLLRFAGGVEGKTWRLSDGEPTSTGWYLTAGKVIEGSFASAHEPNWGPGTPDPISSWTDPKALWILNIANPGGGAGTSLNSTYNTSVNNIGFWNEDTDAVLIIWKGDQ